MQVVEEKNDELKTSRKGNLLEQKGVEGKVMYQANNNRRKD